MGTRSLVRAMIGAFVGAILVAALSLPTSAGSIVGAGVLQTETPAATPTPRPPTPTPTATPRAGALTASPASADIGATITLTGSNFSANALIVVIVEDGDGATVSYTQPSVDGTGNFTVRLDTAGYKPGQYAASVASLPNINTLSRATFTLTGTPAPPGTGSGGNLPGLPNTGDGGGIGEDRLLLVGIGGMALLVLIGLGGIALRRRAA